MERTQIIPVLTNSISIPSCCNRKRNKIVENVLSCDWAKDVKSRNLIQHKVSMLEYFTKRFGQLQFEPSIRHHLCKRWLTKEGFLILFHVSFFYVYCESRKGFLMIIVLLKSRSKNEQNKEYKESDREKDRRCLKNLYNYFFLAPQLLSVR